MSNDNQSAAMDGNEQRKCRECMIHEVSGRLEISLFVIRNFGSLSATVSGENCGSETRKAASLE